MMLEYIHHRKNARIAVVFPLAHSKIDEVMENIESVADVIMHKDIVMDYKETINLLHILYEGEPWMPIGGCITKGVLKHLDNRYDKNIPIRFVFMDSNKEEAEFVKDLTDMKLDVRALFNQGNYPIHINDTYAETVSLARSLLHAESFSVLKIADTYKTGNFLSMIKQIKAVSCPDLWDNFVIDGGGVLSAYGLRDTSDIDYISPQELPQFSTLDFCDLRKKSDAPYDKSFLELLYNLENYFFMFGLKFVSPRLLLEMKKKRNELKDKQDVLLLNNLLERSEKTVFEKIILCKDKIIIKLLLIKGSVRAWRKRKQRERQNKKT